MLEVEGLSKRYTRDLGRSLRYAAADVMRELTARPVRPGGRPLRPGEFAALQDVSFTLERGESLAVVGANGAGKSTLLKLLHGLIKPDAGEIRVHGRVAALIELGTGFDPILTGRENIAVNGAIVGLSAARLREITDEIVAFAEIEHAIDAPVRTYSSGMVARLAFAVAAHADPDVLLIDEVFAVGDMAFQRRCVHHMRAFLQRGGSLILVSHNAQQIQSTCGRGLLLERGQLTYTGSAVATLGRYLAVEQAAPAPDAATGPAPDAVRPLVIDRVAAVPMEGDELRTGEPMRVEIAYRSLHEVAVVWGFNVWTGDGWVCVTGAYDMGATRAVAGPGTLSCTVPRLPLLTGRYQLRSAIVEAETLQPLALHGHDDAPVVLVVQAPATVVNNGVSAMSQLVTLDVDWG